MKHFFLTAAIAAMLACVCVQARSDTGQCIDNQSDEPLLAVFWNLENFFSPGDPSAPERWSRRRFHIKCDAISKVLLLIADEEGRLPDLVAVCEVGDRTVLERLVSTTRLSRLGYGVVHFDSPDKRGIDCGLLYRKSTLCLETARACHIRAADGSVMPTRDILMASFGPGRDGGPVQQDISTGQSAPVRLSVLVNHHPSKLGADAGSRRELALRSLRALADSLHTEGIPVLAVGDFNDTASALSDSLLGPVLEEVHPSGCGAPGDGSRPLGSIKFNGEWELIDRCLVSPGLQARCRVWNSPLLMVHDAAHGGMKPRRTYSGPRYLGGISDHLPVVARLNAGER